MKTVDGKKGGKLVGDAHSAPSGGIRTVNVDTNETLLVEGGEAIINKEATALHKEELSKINQSAGGGVPIMKKGGIVNQYEGKTAEQVWNEWNKVQKSHFLRDHFDKINKNGESDGIKYTSHIGLINTEEDKKYQDLPKCIRRILHNHINSSQYSQGGNINSSLDFGNPCLKIIFGCSDMQYEKGGETENSIYTSYKGHTIFHNLDQNKFMVAEGDAKKQKNDEADYLEEFNTIDEAKDWINQRIESTYNRD